jgi:predicted flap endonuclease-1-like 5' DNA nuclease
LALDVSDGPTTTAQFQSSAGSESAGADGGTDTSRETSPSAASPAGGSAPDPATASDDAQTAAATPAPDPVPAEPAKPSVDDDPQRLMGIGTGELTAMLGDPGFVRHDSTAQLWRYRNESCILDLFLYRGDGRADYFVSHIEARRDEGGSTEKRACFGALLLERQESESS